jgi:hypothetical protein
MTSLDQFDVSLASSPAIARWFESAGYDKDPAAEQQERLVLLADFCRHMDQPPDDILVGCLRTNKHGETAISAKGRNAIQSAIDDFMAATGRTGRDAVVAGNVLRGFLIHNGVFIQGPVWKG